MQTSGMRVAITAAGAVTAHGLGVRPLIAAVQAGHSALQPLKHLTVAGLPASLAGEAPDDGQLVAAARLFSGAPAQDRATRLLLAAAAEALAGRDRAVSAGRAVLVGTTKGAFERMDAGREEDLLGATARALAVCTGARGPVLAIGAACTSSTVALGEACALLAAGAADEVVVGGTEALHPFLFQGFHALRALSSRPAAPFDARRSGLTLGEGAAVLVLEPLERAERSGLPILGTLEGFGTSTDARDQVAPDASGAGLRLACERALLDAQVTAAQVDRYHAHGTGTVQNDRAEAALYRSLFGARAVPVTGIKGSIGHTLGAAGILDVLVCALTLRAGVIPPLTNCEEIAPDARISAVLGQARFGATEQLALVGSAGFGGLNAALVLRRAPQDDAS